MINDKFTQQQIDKYLGFMWKSIVDTLLTISQEYKNANYCFHFFNLVPLAQMEICIPVGVCQKVIRARKVEANERFTVIALLVLAARE